MQTIIKPTEIEAESFRIIRGELQARGISLPPEQEPVTMRVIHTTADFEYAETMTYSAGAVGVLCKLLRSGANVVTDTNMGKAGINKTKLSGYGGEVHCFMADAEIAAEAKARETTRAAVSMEHAAKLPGDTIFVIGNAPTALLALRDMIREGSYRPAFIVGVPVGFVNVVFAKEEIIREAAAAGIPYIVNAGRKGGSNVAAAIINAALYLDK